MASGELAPSSLAQRLILGRVISPLRYNTVLLLRIRANTFATTVFSGNPNFTRASPNFVIGLSQAMLQVLHPTSETPLSHCAPLPLDDCVPVTQPAL